ncbi:putative metalloprotease [Oceanisphaera litoralis]|uniref:M48 family metallopeptidase n=1 Tax=Oceanisphaera litoralis TaxID=225144 RepID=UPI001EF78BB7|nr:M48 family metallopeptidase [Oceanisphaera litoralis]MBM7454597.1 putative metalloprotease [Oceanisphaera litoralis]
MNKSLIAAVLVALGLSGCASSNSDALLGAGLTALQGLTLSKSQLQAEASLSAKQMDAENKLAPAGNAYSQRLARLTRGLTSIEGTPLNFQVYLDDDINAFAMPDGTVRVYSGLMDVMADDELMAVIGHEVGHIKFEHSLNRFKTAYLTSAARQAAVAAGGTVGALAASEYAEIGTQFLGARFSQKDELESDAYGVEFLCQIKVDPYAAMRAQQKLMQHAGSGGGLFSSHPSTAKRIELAREAAANSSCR